VQRVASVLIALKMWDDAFGLIRNLGDVDLLDNLLLQSLESLLDANRLSTIVGWTDFAETIAYESPVAKLARAEVALRQGDHSTADSIAREVITTVGAAHPLTARAQLLAARSAHFVNHTAESFQRASDAYVAAVDTRIRSDAAWARFIAAYELERDDLGALLSDYDDVSYGSPTHRIRMLAGRTLCHLLDGSVTDVLVPAEHVIHLASQVRDPMARTSFAVRQAHALQIAAQYGPAAKILDALLTYARAAHLDFVFPHALALRAAVQAGVRDFGAAEISLDEALVCAPADPFVAVHTRYMRARVLLAQQRYDEAQALTARQPRVLPSACFVGEYLAIQALALACLDRPDRALAVAQRAEATTRMRETHCLAAAARAVVAVRRGAEHAASEFFNFVSDFGGFDLLVTAYRAYPNLLRPMLTAHLREELRLVCARANDLDLLETVNAQASLLAVLTAREREVLALLAGGLSNREIASKLVISEVTAKVHVRHVCHKLGARSRTEAAVKATQLLPSWPGR
jgi:ATP/maltotriose-dependent transcriptional regulator MalT